MKGWIYVISNQAVPDWLAIGCSEVDPEALVRQYGNSGIKLPYPFELQYALRTRYPKSVLQHIHEELAEQCVNPNHNQDWFECGLLDSIKLIRRTAGNSATGEMFYGRARRLIEQHERNAHDDEAMTTPPTRPTAQSRTPAVKQRVSPEVKRTASTVTAHTPTENLAPKSAPSAPQPSKRVAPNAMPRNPVETNASPTPETEEAPKDQSKLVATLIVVWVILLIILVFLVAYVFEYI